MKRLFLPLFALLLVARLAAETPLLVLVSLDAFRWDYCALYPAETPNLRQLIHDGVSARSLVPAFPSNTFPNHYTLVTGLYPSHHGIINNEFFDPTRGEFFHYNRAASVADSRWWGGEPIWVTAVKQGRPSAVSFWVGSEAEIAGAHATYWKIYDKTLTFQKRLDELTDWLRLPPAKQPAVTAIYLEETNSIGHKYGPHSPELAAAVRAADSRIGAIRRLIDVSHLDVNLVVVSDHGMAEISEDRVVVLDDYIDVSTVQIECDAPVAGLRPLSGSVDDLMAKFAHLTHAKAYRTADLPAHFHISPNPRNPPVWIVGDEGWEVYSRAKLTLYHGKFNHGDHGYDPASPNMHGILIAQGPSFKATGAVIPDVENVHVYNLLCAAAGLKPAPNDGDDRLVRAMLK